MKKIKPILGLGPIETREERRESRLFKSCVAMGKKIDELEAQVAKFQALLKRIEIEMGQGVHYSSHRAIDLFSKELLNDIQKMLKELCPKCGAKKDFKFPSQKDPGFICGSYFNSFGDFIVGEKCLPK